MCSRYSSTYAHQTVVVRQLAGLPFINVCGMIIYRYLGNIKMHIVLVDT